MLGSLPVESSDEFIECSLILVFLPLGCLSGVSPGLGTKCFTLEVAQNNAKDQLSASQIGSHMERIVVKISVVIIRHLKAGLFQLMSGFLSSVFWVYLFVISCFDIDQILI